MEKSYIPDDNVTVVPQDRSLPDWYTRDFEGYPIVYPISLHYLHTYIQFGRITNVIWYVIGFIGNIISMKIWIIPRMKRINSSAMYLVCISLCDIFYQIFHIFFYLKYFWGLPAMGYPGLCETFNVLNMVPQYASQLLVLGFTTERFISICQPFRGERFSRRQRAPRTIAAIMIFVFILSLPQGYFWQTGSFGFCAIRYEMFDDVVLMKLYTIWSYTTESIIFFIVPCTTLIINVIVLRKTQKSLNAQTRFNHLGVGETRIHRKGTTCRPSTITLLCISFFRILTQLPISIVFMLQNTFTSGRLMSLPEIGNDPQWQKFLTFYGIRIAVETLGTSHHALSFLIFYVSTKQFRIEFRRMCITVKNVIVSRDQQREPYMMDDYKSGVRSSFTRGMYVSSARSNESSVQ